MAYAILHDILLSVHNLALVVCAGAPFFWWFHTLGSKDTNQTIRFIRRTLPWVWLGLSLLLITGIGIPVGRMLFAGVPQEMHPVAGIASKVKVACVVALIAVYVRVRIKIVKGALCAPEEILHRYLKLAMLFAAGALVSSPWIRFGMG